MNEVSNLQCEGTTTLACLSYVQLALIFYLVLEYKTDSLPTGQAPFVFM